MISRCTHDPVRVVASQPLFASLSEAECAAVVERSVCRSVGKGEALFREGEPCRGLYLVVEGVVRSYRANGDGQEQVLGVFGPGASLGEVSLFDGGPYLASARATRDGRILFLPFGEVHALYRTHPQVAQAVVREMGNRVRSLTALVDQLALRDVPTRVAAAILRYAGENADPHRAGSFHLPRTQEELAAELGTTREGVSRALRNLRAEAVIAQRGARIEVLDPARLQRMAGQSGRAAPASGHSVGNRPNPVRV